jgi:hypothetical protein
MNCTDLQNQIDEYCSGALSSEPRAECETHLASCSECSRAVDGHNHLLASLKAMPVIGPSKGFTERVLSVAMNNRKDHEEDHRSVERNVHHHRRGFMVGFGSAAVAALALWTVVGILPQQAGIPKTASVESNVESTVGKEIPEFSIVLNEQRDIKLAFFSSEDLKGATITLQIPEAIALVGYEGRRKLAWETNLVKGDNTLRLPIVATSKSGGQLVAHIEYKGKVRTLKVNLAVGDSQKAPGLSGRTGLELRIV